MKKYEYFTEEDFWYLKSFSETIEILEDMEKPIFSKHKPSSIPPAGYPVKQPKIKLSYAKNKRIRKNNRLMYCNRLEKK